MKYVRTENGIFEVLSEYDTPENTTLISNLVMAFNAKVTPRNYSGASIRIIYSNEVISQADTIKELCDRFVVETCDNTKFWLERSLEFAKIYCGIKNIYGAIWVIDDNGVPILKPVAKMNENGDLELI